MNLQDDQAKIARRIRTATHRGIAALIFVAIIFVAILLSTLTPKPTSKPCHQ